MITLAAKPFVDAHREALKARVLAFKQAHGRAPGLSVVLVGEDPASQIYVRNKGRAAEAVGIVHETVLFPATASPAEVQAKIKALNQSNTVDGILIQRPLPKGFDESAAIFWVDPAKDVDCFHPENVGRLALGLPGLRSCTPSGVMRLLEHYKIQLAGKTACVVGRSAIVGKPMAQLLTAADCTVTQAHSRTKNLAEVTRHAEILIAAAGKPGLIGKEHVRPGAVVVDVGIHRQDDGSIVGDVRADEVAGIASALTPVPGGVGPTTIALLLENTVLAAERAHA